MCETNVQQGGDLLALNKGDKFGSNLAHSGTCTTQNVISNHCNCCCKIVNRPFYDNCTPALLQGKLINFICFT